MNIPNDTVIKTVPAAAALRKVPGFNPLKYLSQTVSKKTGQNVLKLDLRYKRLWFRLACPNGRMLLNPLHITDQMAIYEAMVYMSKDDAEPLARVTSTVTAQDAPNGQYIQSAQDAALDEALENAGFGIQLCDFVEGTGGADYGSEVTLDTNAVMQAAAVQQKTATEQCETVSSSTTPAPSAQGTAPTSAPAPASPAPSAQTQPPKGTSQISEEQTSVSNILETMQETHNDTVPAAGDSAAPEPAAPAAPGASTSAPAAETSNVTISQASPAPAAPETVEETASNTGNAGELTPMELLMGKQSPVIPFPSAADGAGQTETAGNAAAPLDDTPPMPQNTAEAAPSATYTADMTVAEIMERMTQDEAKAVVVQNGVCKGWTIAQVAERRPASLRYYMCSPTADNILKAAAQLMLGETLQQKAG